MLIDKPVKQSNPDRLEKCKNGHWYVIGQPCVSCGRKRAREQSARRKAQRSLLAYAREILELETALSLAPEQFPDVAVELRAAIAVKMAAFEELCGSGFKADSILKELRNKA